MSPQRSVSAVMGSYSCADMGYFRVPYHNEYIQYAYPYIHIHIYSIRTQVQLYMSTIQTNTYMTDFLNGYSWFTAHFISVVGNLYLSLGIMTLYTIACLLVLSQLN